VQSRDGRLRTYTSPVIDMTKATDAEQPAERPVPPRTINLAIAAVCVQVVFMVVHIASMFAYTDQLSRLLRDSNAKLKKPHNPYGAAEIANDLHRIRVNGLWQGIIVAAALLLLAFSLRRVNTASVTRWALIVVMVMTGGPLAVNPVRGLPVVPQIASVLAGVASIVAIVCLFLPESRKYFKAVAAARMAATGRQPRAARGSLFAPRPSVQRKPPLASGLRSSAASRGQAKVSNSGATSGSRSKALAHEAAVARGAELARSRAKASKSRRTEL
jgi:hypothetical protein